jgi:DNA-binding NtrC family response regulator
MELREVKNRFGIIGDDPKLNNALNTALQISGTNLSVLITGESGVGKRSFPR